jgi:hypothetical protein
MRHSKFSAKTLKTSINKIQIGFHPRSLKEDVMKRNAITMLSLVVMSLILIPTVAHAQSREKANVPFAFHAGMKQLPAGTYEITVEGRNSNTIMIRNVETWESVLVTARPEQPGKTEGKLVFDRAGNQYFLAEVWRNSGTGGMIVPTYEKKLAKELQLAQAPSGGYEKVSLALK